jgi:hypothetical protein
VPFVTASEQDGAWQTPALQTSLAQSAPERQPWPAMQPGQLSPQSTADSLPFRTPSEQLGA